MSLDVYLGERQIGTLSPNGDKGYSFAYAPELVEEVRAGTPLLSHSLPVRAEPYGPAEIRPYVEGLLPEGARRTQIARELCVDRDDGYALIAELGRDCPGAVTFLPEGEAPEPRDDDSLAWLSEDELEELLTAPRGLFDPAHERRMRFTLPGERHKLALVRDEVGDRWAWPEAGAPSTHIVKPQSDERPGLAANEMACTSALREMGLPVAHAELRTIAGRPCLVSRRFDRRGCGGGAERVHQESFNQALGIAPGEEPSTIHGFVRSRELLKSIGEEDGVETLFRVAFCNYLLDNGDDHGKNAALLFTDAGPALAPFYDIASTAIYEPPPTQAGSPDVAAKGSCLAGMTRIAIPCDLEFMTSALIAFRTTFDLCVSLSHVATEAKREGWHTQVIERIRERASSRVNAFRQELNDLRPPGSDPL